MIKLRNLLFGALLVFVQAGVRAATDPVDYVSTLVGTHSSYKLSTGNTYPAIALPWGMNFWTPQTGKMGDGWAYTYDADRIRGFKETHQPSPWINDYGQVALMPVTGAPVFDEDKRASWFSHKAETATPYYYKVYLADHDVTTEITPTERAAYFRFTFPDSEHSYVVVDGFDQGSYMKVIPSENKIVGYTTKNSGGVPENFKNYFVMEFSKPFTYTATVSDSTIDTSKLEVKTDHAGAIVGFATRRGEQVLVRVASSFISPEQAEVNLKELGQRSFEEVKQAGRQRWNEVLGRIEVKDDNLDNLRTFYSCLYRSVLFPRSFYEIGADGKPVHYSPYNGQVLPGYMFTTRVSGTRSGVSSRFSTSCIRRSTRRYRPAWCVPTMRAASCPNGHRPDTEAAWWATTRLLSWPMPTLKVCVATTSRPCGKPSCTEPTACIPR